MAHEWVRQWREGEETLHRERQTSAAITYRFNGRVDSIHRDGWACHFAGLHFGVGDARVTTRVTACKQDPRDAVKSKKSGSTQKWERQWIREKLAARTLMAETVAAAAASMTSPSVCVHL